VENKTWEKIKDVLVSCGKNKTSKYWLDQVKISSSSEEELLFTVPSVFIKDSFEKKFGKILKQELLNRGFSSNYKIVVDEVLASALFEKKEIPNPISNTPNLEELVLEEKSTFSLSPFEDFYTGSSNSLAVIAAKTVVEKPGERFNPLFIYGRPGVGKTFLLKTIEKTREDSLYIGSEDFLNSFVQSIKKGTTEKFKERVRGNKLLLLDDIQFLSGKKAASEELLHTVNHYIENGGGIVLVSDVKPKDLFGFPERLISRVYSGLVTDVEKPDKELLSGYLKKAQKEIGLNKESLSKLSSFPFENFRELKGLLNGLSLNKEMDLNVDLLVNSFVEEKQKFSLSRKTPEDLVLFVSNKYQVDKDLLFSKNRTERVANARHVLIGLLRKHTDMSLKQIGIYLGNRSHSTIISSLKKLQENSDLLTGVNSLDTEEQEERVG